MSKTEMCVIGGVFGLLAGLFMVVLLGVYLGTWDKEAAYNNAISACEAELPRNQHCIITAIPDVE